MHYDSFTIDAGSLGALAKDSVLQTYGKASAGGVKGVYELSITSNATAGDKISINGIEFEFASEAGAGKVVVGASASASAANLDNVLEQELALTSVFDITYSGVKVIFTQKVAGVGAIPTLVVTPESTGTLAAAIEQETAGVAADSYPVNPDGLCPVDVEIDAEPTVSVMFRADGIVETTLPLAVTPAIWAALPFCQFLNIYSTMATILEQIQNPKAFDAFINENMKTSTYQVGWDKEMPVEYEASRHTLPMADYAAAMLGTVIDKTASSQRDMPASE